MPCAPLALLGLALAAPGTPAVRPPPARETCTRYQVMAERNALAPEAEVAAWGAAGLTRAGLLDPASPCFLHVRITAGPIHTGGREDGFAAHVAVSTRRLQKDGKLVTREKGFLFVEATREAVLGKARAFVEDFAGRLGAPPAAGPGGAGGTAGDSG